MAGIGQRSGLQHKPAAQDLDQTNDTAARCQNGQGQTHRSRKTSDAQPIRLARVPFKKDTLSNSPRQTLLGKAFLAFHPVQKSVRQMTPYSPMLLQYLGIL
jgi:hypothetical protein